LKRTLSMNALIRAFPIIGVAIALLSQCHSTAVMNSVRPKKAIVIDGNIADWEGLITPVADERFGMGIANDDSALYLGFLSNDRGVVHQVMRYGMTIWFKGGKSKHDCLGIHFPLGMANSGMDFHRFREAQGDTGEMRKIMEESFDVMEVLGPGKRDTVPMKTAIAESFGIRLKVAAGLEKCTYEAKIPLYDGSLSIYTVPVAKDSLITIVLCSEAPEFRGGNEGGGHDGYPGEGGGMRGERGGGFSGGPGFGGHSGGRHGGMGGARGHGGRHEPAAPFSAEFRVRLAGK
jgi:hypothetical protein